MPVTLSATTTTRGIDRRALAKKARVILDAIELGDCELSIALTDDSRIRELNREYRNRDRPTDVLSFSLREGEYAEIGDALGDVVISVDTARRQALENGLDLDCEIERLLVHGVLHLAGYDHEVSAREARRMRRQEARLRALLASSFRPKKPPARRRPNRNRGGPG